MRSSGAAEPGKIKGARGPPPPSRPQPPHAPQQLRRLEQRQPHHVGMGARQEAHEDLRPALDRRSRRPCPAIRRRRGKSSTCAAVSRWKATAVSTSRASAAAVRAAQRDAGHDMVPPAGEQAEAARAPPPRSRPWPGCGGRRRPRYRRPAPARPAPRRPQRRLAGGQPRGELAGQLRLARGLVDIGGEDAVGDHADPGQQVQPPRAGRGQHQRAVEASAQALYLKRKVMRPLDRS